MVVIHPFPHIKPSFPGRLFYCLSASLFFPYFRQGVELPRPFLVGQFPRVYVQVILQQRGSSSRRRRMCCLTLNGYRQPRRHQEPTTAYSGERCCPSMTRSGRSTAQATAGTASASCGQPTRTAPPDLPEQRRTIRSPDWRTILARTDTSSPTSIRTIPTAALRASTRATGSWLCSTTSQGARSTATAAER